MDLIDKSLPRGQATLIGLTINKYWKRVGAARVIRRYPEAAELFESGEIEVSHLSMIAGRITDANSDVLLEGIRGKTKRDAESFISRVTSRGEILDREGFTEITMRLCGSENEIVQRAREVLAHGGHVSACPGEVANERTEDACLGEVASKNQRKTIPGEVRNAIWLRDKGQCTFHHEDGTRCQSKSMIEVDHILMICRGGTNGISNLRLRCRFHNRHTAELMLERALPRKNYLLRKI